MADLQMILGKVDGVVNMKGICVIRRTKVTKYFERYRTRLLVSVKRTIGALLYMSYQN